MMGSLGECLRHPTIAAAFRCRQCTDPVCAGCRAKGEKDLCIICDEYHQMIDRIEAQGGTEAMLEARQRRSPWTRHLIVGLVALDLIALGAFFAFSSESESAPEVAVSPALRDAAAVVSGVVAQNRDESGRYPMSLDAVIDRLSPEVAEMVRHGAITYWTSPDNSRYEVGVYPPNAVSLPR
jgi:hypothetical protein